MAYNTISMPTELKVASTNISPDQGLVLSSYWFGLHDGSFDYFNAGEAASIALEGLAEDASTGDPQGQQPPEILEALIAGGTDFSLAPTETLADEFAASDAAQNNGYQAILLNDNLNRVPIVHDFPGETTEFQFTVPDFNATQHGYFSYASMPFPTNDAFIGNDDPMEVSLFDADGNFVGANFVVVGSDVWDAGTEVNTESPDDVPFALSQLFKGPDENGVVHKHEPLMPPGAGGVVDFELNGETPFANSDFTAPNYEVAQITVSGIYQGTRQGDLIVAGVGDDEINGKRGNDLIAGGLGNDLIQGGRGHDILRGDLNNRDPQSDIAGGDDIIHGGRGNDRIGGKSGNDTLYGDQGKDAIWGDAGDDLLDGGRGKDTLIGGIGSDQLVGGRGKDILTGVDPSAQAAGFGEFDQMTGGKGADRFILGDKKQTYYLGQGLVDHAAIFDFSLAEGDVIQLHGEAADYSLGAFTEGEISGVTIVTGGDLVGAVAGISLADLSLSDTAAFEFVG